MHIAVCDDNVADRKQLERLLKRESDKRAASTGIIYTDSFGNSTSLLSNPMQYDAFYIDMCLTEGITGTEVANALIAQGVNAPIVLCCSKINYREQTYPENVIFLDKPIKVAELGQSIDHALDIMSKAVPLIELREDEDTVYVTEPDILYAEEEGRNVIVTLKDGRTVKVATTAINLFSQIENHPTFFAPSHRLDDPYRQIHGEAGLPQSHHVRWQKICSAQRLCCLCETAAGGISCVKKTPLSRMKS